MCLPKGLNNEVSWPIFIVFLLETVAKTGMILLAGEVTSRAVVDYQKVVRDTIKHIGYDDSSKGLFDDTIFYYRYCSVHTSIQKCGVGKIVKMLCRRHLIDQKYIL